VEWRQRGGEEGGRHDLVSEEFDLVDLLGDRLTNPLASWVSIPTRDSAERLLMVGRDSESLPLKNIVEVVLKIITY
jgi:hypothetical protein